MQLYYGTLKSFFAVFLFVSVLLIPERPTSFMSWNFEFHTGNSSIRNRDKWKCNAVPKLLVVCLLELFLHFSLLPRSAIKLALNEKIHIGCSGSIPLTSADIDHVFLILCVSIYWVVIVLKYYESTKKCHWKLLPNDGLHKIFTSVNKPKIWK